MLHEQIHASVIDDESLPWIPLAPYSDHVLIKYFRLDPVRGEMIALVKAPEGTRLPRHRHSGSSIVYTIEGRWKCKEHDWIAGPGSVVFDNAASTRTPEVVGSDGPVVALNIVAGELVFLGENDEVLAIENWQTALQRYLAYCERALITPLDLTAIA